MPEPLVERLKILGHQVDSVNSLRLKGLDNGRLFREIVRGYDVCFTRDREFVRTYAEPTDGSVKLLRVTLSQTRAPEFIATFVAAFEGTRWSDYPNGADWPR